MKKIITTIAALITIYTVTAQVKVGDNPLVMNANSLLELESTTKGLLFPRVALLSTTSFAPLTAHLAGMTVYNTNMAGIAPTNVIPGLYYNDGTKWIRCINQDNQPGYYGWLKTGALQTTDAGDNSVNVYHMAGNVGIGVAAPTALLDVRGNGSGNTAVIRLMNTNVAGNPTLNIYPGYTSNGSGISSGFQYAVVFDQDPGTSSNGVASQSLYDFHGQVRAITTSTLSDRRLKENITDMNQYGLKEVLAMQPRNYTLKKYQTKDIGLIAQELKTIVPELVSGAETENELLSVDYAKICLILLNAMKEQKAELEALKATNSELTAEAGKVDSIDKELTDIKTLVEKLTDKMARK